MKLSFKFKIAIISFALSGALLTTFGFVFFAFIHRSGLERIDRELRALVEAPLRGGHPTHYWADFGTSLSFIYEGRTEQIALRATDRTGRVLYQSEDAPKQLAALPLPKLPAAPPPPDQQPREGFIQHLDRNGDQTVTPDEFDGPADMFSRHDLDGNGRIDADEATALNDRRNEGRMLRLRRQGRPPGSADGSPPPIFSRFTTLQDGDTNWRIGIFNNPETVVMAAMDMDSFNAEIDQLQTVFMIAVPTGLMLLGIAGWFLASRAMKPVAAIADTAEGITARGLDRRIPQVGNDIELERLVTVSNRMLDRIEKSYHQAVRFSADAAHELQTPLTILQGELDNAIQSAADGSDEQQRYGMLLEELSNLKSVVQKLLLLAHADEGRLNLNRQTVNLSELLQSATEDLEIMAPELQIEAHIPQGLTLQADPALLNQVLRNMISNAAKYTEENGRVVFILKKEADRMHFTLSNSAQPIPEADRSLLFERFHRVDKARTTSGSGLGLSLAREIARAHGGDLILKPYADGMVSFQLILPAIAPKN